MSSYPLDMVAPTGAVPAAARVLAPTHARVGGPVLFNGLVTGDATVLPPRGAPD